MQERRLGAVSHKFRRRALPANTPAPRVRCGRPFGLSARPISALSGQRGVRRLDADAETERADPRGQFGELKTLRTKLLEAHYAGAIP